MKNLRKSVNYKGHMVDLVRCGKVNARYLFNSGKDIYFVTDEKELNRKFDIRSFYHVTNNQGIKDFDLVEKVFRTTRHVRKNKTILYFILDIENN